MTWAIYGCYVKNVARSNKSLLLVVVVGHGAVYKKMNNNNSIGPGGKLLCLCNTQNLDAA